MTLLQDQLDEITANTRHLVQAERLAVGERAVEELFATGIENRILPLYGQLRDRGALMVAVGPQIERQSDFMVSQHGIPFPVLSDPGCALAEQFGLVYTVPEYYREYYLSILVNIPFVNGDKSWRLPLPATYVIGRDNRVLFAEAHADFRVRPEPQEVLAAVSAALRP
jgi:peroxiredoxin